MHGLIARSLQRFVTVTYGVPAWRRIAARAEVPDGGFDTMLDCPDRVFDRVLDAASAQFGKDRATLLEDMGTFLIAHPDIQVLRRLLRFSGPDFASFLDALEDLPDRVRLAVPALDLPALEVRPLGHQEYRVVCAWPLRDGVHVVAGLLRAMADDYGTLAFLDLCEDENGTPCIDVSILDGDFSRGRLFDLGAGGATP